MAVCGFTTFISPEVFLCKMSGYMISLPTTPAPLGGGLTIGTNFLRLVLPVLLGVSFPLGGGPENILNIILMAHCLC